MRICSKISPTPETFFSRHFFLLVFFRETESRKLLDDIRTALVSTAAVEVGALGLSAIFAASLLDITGLLGAGVLAASGLAIIPYRRVQLKRAFLKKVANIREPLKISMQTHFDHELQESVKKIEDNIEPYSRFIRAEKEKIEKLSGQLRDLQNTIEVSRMKIENLFKAM